MALSRINTNQIVDGAVATADIADGLITTAKLADGAVTTAKITDGNISTSKLADDAVTTAKVNPTQTDITQVGTLTSFASTGIDDNADATAITIDSSERLHVGTESLTSKLNVVGDGNTQGLSIKSGGATGVNPFQVTWSAGSEGAMLKVDDNGNTHIGIGNLVIGTSGKGIDFSATSDGSGSMSSELLDDYEEGTWTASLISSTGITFSSSERNYVKIGRVVYINIQCSFSGTSSVRPEISGLPFASSDTSAFTIFHSGGDLPKGSAFLAQTHSGHNRLSGGKSASDLTFSEVNGCNMRITGCYLATA